jgi:hydrogenase maturation protein HypF
VPPPKLSAREIHVNGIVQGVGFRPCVYQLAYRLQLTGEVANTSAGVTIRLEGQLSQIEAFVRELTVSPPPLAQITDITSRNIPAQGFAHFTIVPSECGQQIETLISPDVCVCQDCLAELFDPADRRYRYPFINCTNCGPRYTIIEDIPYDRPKTSMKHFRMCPNCQAEYDDPANRRFHAQPNACFVCGPHIGLYDTAGRKILGDDAVNETVRQLKQGAIVAVKGLGGYHLAVDAADNAAVQRLRARKRREEKPLALMAASIDVIRQFSTVNPLEKSLLSSHQRPIVLLNKKASHPIAAAVAPNNRYFGVMLPYTPLHYLLLDAGFCALVMTSANLSDLPICIRNEDAFEKLKGVADYFLIHNRKIYLRSDDSIVRPEPGHTQFIRRSRGYVPTPVFLKNKMASVLAVGGGLKNTVCLTKGNQAFLSQHIGDLENLETYAFFKQSIRHMKRILAIFPQMVAYDLHPDYLSTRYAQELNGMLKVPIQHHHAHIVSCMAENQVDGPVIGLALDGTEYGTDGAIWGGEVLICRAEQFERAAHIAYTPMPGGNAAIREPWRMGLSYLFATFGPECLAIDIGFLRAIPAHKSKDGHPDDHKKHQLTADIQCGKVFRRYRRPFGVIPCRVL